MAVTDETQRKRETALRLRAAGTPWSMTARLSGYYDKSSVIKACRAEVERMEREGLRLVEEAAELRASMFREGSEVR